MRADTVVVAAGFGSGLLRVVARPSRRHRMVGLTVTLPAGAVAGLGHRLLVDRAPSGWWYALADEEVMTATYCTDPGLLGASGTAGLAVPWRDAVASAADWLPSSVAALAPRVRAIPVGMTTPVIDGDIRIVGDAALAVDPLSGLGLALAFESARRWADPGYAEWAAETAAMHARVEREVYRAASGPLDGRFWSARM